MKDSFSLFSQLFVLDQVVQKGNKGEKRKSNYIVEIPFYRLDEDRTFALEKEWKKMKGPDCQSFCTPAVQSRSLVSHEAEQKESGYP